MAARSLILFAVGRGALALPISSRSTTFFVSSDEEEANNNDDAIRVLAVAVVRVGTKNADPNSRMLMRRRSDVK